MWHLFKNSVGQFEFAFISKGKYVAGTKQGYERRSTALSSLFSLIHSVDASTIKTYYHIQDDTGERSVIIGIGPKGKQIIIKGKPGKPYKL